MFIFVALLTSMTMLKDQVKTEIENWINGDDSAYRRVFDGLYPKLYSLCLKAVRQSEDSEEIVMNVFFNIWQRRSTLHQVDNFMAYFIQSLRNQIGGYKRKKVLLTQELDTVPLEALGYEQHPEMVLKELESRYRAALNKLTEKQRELFILSREEGLSQKEIAERQNLSPNTVNNHITAALKVMRQDMGSFSEALPLLILLISSQR